MNAEVFAVLRTLDAHLRAAERRLAGRKPHPNDLAWARTSVEDAREELVKVVKALERQP